MSQLIADTFYLALSLKQNGHFVRGLAGRLTKRKTDLRKGEIAVEVRVEVPRALFMQPTLRFDMKIPEGAVSAPVIDAEVSDDIAAVLQERLGMRVELSVPGVDDGDSSAS